MRLKRTIQNAICLGLCMTMFLSSGTEAAISNPVFNASTSTTTYSTVEFGSYPQTELTGTGLTSAIKTATYSASGDAIIDGNKYKKVTTYCNAAGTEKTYTTPKYFKYEPIKWRVLHTDNGSVKLITEKSIDFQPYSIWDHSTYSGETLNNWIKNSFIPSAFTSTELSGMETIDNAKVSIPKLSDVISTSYGFATSITASVSRTIAQSGYCSALSGTNTSASWFIQSGYVAPDGAIVTAKDNSDTFNHYKGIVPTITIKESMINQNNQVTNATPTGSSIAAPKKVKVSVVNTTTHKLTWSKVKSVTGYQIYASTKKNGTYKKVASTKKLKANVKKRIKGSKYYYKIRAYKKNTSSLTYGNFSKAVSKLAGCPGKPILRAKKSVINGKRVIVLKWSNVKDADKINLYRSKNKKAWKALFSAKISKKTKNGCIISYTYTSGTFYFRIRTNCKVKGKKLNSTYSKTVKITI